METYYSLLGLEQDASEKDIKKAKGMKDGKAKTRRLKQLNKELNFYKMKYFACRKTTLRYRISFFYASK